MQIQDGRWFESVFFDKWRHNEVKLLLKITSV